MILVDKQKFWEFQNIFIPRSRNKNGLSIAHIRKAYQNKNDLKENSFVSPLVKT